MIATASCSLHVVSLQVPYPPDYGGVIDIYYKLKALKEAGLVIWLHTFQYERAVAEELEQVADRVTYYPRDCSVSRQLGVRPYIVESRRHRQLLADLLADDAPILFEGLHCCAFLDDRRLAGRLKLVRAHNVEHDYYRGLAGKSTGWESWYYQWEACKLKRYEKVLASADVILAITESDRRYFASQYREVSTVLLPAFHPHPEVSSLVQKGDYILYHGNLSVEENVEAVEYLLRQVVPLLPSVSWIFAGKNPSERIERAIADCPRVRLVANPSDNQMFQLIREARANLLITFQPTGLKLKLLHALFLGGTCIVNPAMLEGTDLASTCVVADTPRAMASAVEQAFKNPFTPQQCAERVKLLERYDNRANARVIARIIGEGKAKGLR